MPDDDVEHRIALEDRARQHRSVRAAEQNRKVGSHPFQLARNTEGVQKAAAEGGKADDIGFTRDQRRR